MPLTVIHSSLRVGHPGDGTAGPHLTAADYSIAVDGSIQSGDLVVYSRTSLIGGGGNGFFAEWDDGLGPKNLLGGLFSVDGGVNPFAVPPDATLATASGATMYVNEIAPEYLDDGFGNPLLRFGCICAQNGFIHGTGFACWVIRQADFNTFPPGSDAEDFGPFNCPVTLIPVPDQGVLSASAMLFGMSYFQWGDEAEPPGPSPVVITQNLAGFNELQAGEVFAQPSRGTETAYSVCSIWSAAQDATGQAFDLDTVPSGGTVPANGFSGAAGILGVLDLVDAPIISEPGFGMHAGAPAFG